MPSHRQQPTMHPRQGRTEVDELLAPVLEQLWGAGCDTAFSCQGDTNEPAQIGFVGWRALTTGLDLMAERVIASGNRRLFLRMAQCSIDPQDGSPVRGTSWLIQAHPTLWWRARAPRPPSWPHDDFLFCVLTFPSDDLDPLTHAVCQKGLAKSDA